MYAAQDTVSTRSYCSSTPKCVVRRANLTGFCKQQPQAGNSKLRTSRPLQVIGAHSSQRGSLPVVTQPWSCNDVDRDLWTVLDLASDEELEGVHDILFETSLLSPLIKSILTAREPAALKHRGRAAVMHRIEQRMRFLAADSTSTLRGQYPSYRELLLRICHKLDIKCPSTLITEDLETEVLMHILEQQKQSASSAALQTAPSNQQHLPGVTALKQLGTQVLAQHARYEAALAVVCKTGATYKKRAALQAAQQGFTSAAAKYSTARGVLSFLGPAMWVWLGMDLALKAIGPDYSRVVKAVSWLAQIRLLHTHGFTNPP